jgi:hypothetical protein
VGIGNPAETKFSFGLLIADYEQFLACAWDRSKQLSQLPSRVRVGWDGSGGFSIAARCDIRTMAGH